MVPGNKTRYLAELVAGDEVLIVNTEGETRTAYVGRSKIERRPLLLLEAEYEGKTIRTLLQNAETIRIVDENNDPLSVADVKPGDKVKVYIETNARHFGIAIDETIIEQWGYNMSQIRAFLAIDLDDDLKPKINKVIKQFKQIDTNIKYVELLNLHLTLKFFGEIDTEGLKLLESKIANVVSEFKPFNV